MPLFKGLRRSRFILLIINQLQKCVIGAQGRNRTGVHGFAGRCITTLPHSQSFITVKKKRLLRRLIWSGKRDSNSRPQPWQGCALPTELFPRLYGMQFYRFISPCQQLS